MTALEDMIIAGFKDENAPVERALLVVSGLETEEAIYSYQRKLDLIQKDFERFFPERAGDYQIAKSLFDYFWETKPRRYNGDFLLTKVIDNQLDEDRNKRVGNCLGLTSLYGVLGQRLGLNLSILLNTRHILNLLSCSNQEIVVENTSIRGFNIKGECGYEKKDLIEIVITALNNKEFAEKRPQKLFIALQNCYRAIELNPNDATAHYNMGALRELCGDLLRALKDYNRAIELKPDHILAKQAKEQLIDYLKKPWYKKIFSRR